jgi:hypothetical protein
MFEEPLHFLLTLLPIFQIAVLSKNDLCAYSPKSGIKTRQPKYIVYCSYSCCKRVCVLSNLSFCTVASVVTWRIDHVKIV